MNDRETILSLIEQYKKAIHTGAPEDFFPIWAEEHPTTLISIGRKFSGTENIFRESDIQIRKKIVFDHKRFLLC